MARGHQKFQSQQKNAQKMEKLKKAQGHDQKSSAQKALVFTCSVCKVQYMYTTYGVQYFEFYKKFLFLLAQPILLGVHCNKLLWFLIVTSRLIPHTYMPWELENDHKRLIFMKMFWCVKQILSTTCCTMGYWKHGF